MKKILFVSTGGTISSQADQRKGYSPFLKAKDFVEELKDFKELEIETWQPCNLLSFALDINFIIRVVNIIKKRLIEGGFAGAVLTQGTATMEETAFLTDLIWDIEEPLVFTGAMLNASEKDCDGPRNIRNSVLTASSPDSKGKGVLVCMAGEIHAARDVTKIHKTSLSPFVSVNSGPLGVVANQNDVIYFKIPRKRDVFIVESIEKKVDILKVSLGCDARLFEASVASGVNGIVIEGFPGGGGVTPEIMEAVSRLKNEQIVIALAPRSIFGTYFSTAGGGCGPFNLYESGVIPCGDLTSVKARILMMILLEKKIPREEIFKIFKIYAP